MEQKAGLHLNIDTLCIVQVAKLCKIAGDVVEGRDGNDALGITDHIVVELRVSSGKNDIKIVPARGGSGKGELCVAAGDNNVFLIYIADIFELAVLGDTVKHVKNNKICIALVNMKMLFVGKSALQNLKRE